MIVFAFIAVAGLVGAGALHVYWALGGTWPGSDRSDLARKVVGDTAVFPSAAMTFAVAGLLLAAALVVGGATDLWTLPFSDQLVRAAAWIAAAVFVLRGLAGLVISGIREVKGRGTAFTGRDLRLYSPFALAIGLATVVALFTSP